MMSPEGIEPTNLSNITLSLATSLWHKGVVTSTDEEMLAKVEEALIATIRHLGDQIHDSIYELEDGTRRRVAHDPGFYGFEGAVVLDKPFRRLTLTIEDGEWQPRT
jgi:hypothetical protein